MPAAASKLLKKFIEPVTFPLCSLGTKSAWSDEKAELISICGMPYNGRAMISLIGSPYMKISMAGKRSR